MDAGVPLTYLQEQLHRLGISEEYELRASTVHRQGQQAIKALVELNPNRATESSPQPNIDKHQAPAHPPRHLPQIEQLIQQAQLPQRAETWSLSIFRTLAIAEGAVHGVDPNQVHFHEVGATDAIVDIVGTCLGLDWLGIEQVYCSPLPTGGGTVHAAHGRLPVPAPAVLKLWEQHQVPVYSNGIERELVTPTGAAIAVTLAHKFGPPPSMNLETVGLGAGDRALPLPNILRLWVGSRSEPLPMPQGDLETIAVLETQIDDLNPQAIGYAFDALLSAGAVDVFTQAVGMKKSRPGILLTVICPPTAVGACERVLFQETSTLGIRRSHQQRTVLQRTIQSVETPYGPVRIKIAAQGSVVLNAQPEYEDCAHLARHHQLPWREVQQTALVCWYRQQEQIQA